MQKNFRHIITMLIIVCFMFSYSTVVCAENTKETALLERIPSEFIAKPTLDIDTVIKNTLTKERVETYDNLLVKNSPNEYTYDTSLYLVEYSVSENYWSEVRSLDYNGITEVLYTDYPTIYIPIFAKISDTKGDLHNRAVGYIKFEYSSTRNDDLMYHSFLAIENLASENFKDKKQVGAYEEILYYLERSKTTPEQVFLIKYPSSLSDELEKVAVIKTETDTVILDISDSLHTSSETKNSDELIAYSISEYSSLRKEVEKELYKTADSLENVRYGGTVNADENNEFKYLPHIVIPGIVLTTVIAGTIIWFVFKKRRKNTTA